MEPGEDASAMDAKVDEVLRRSLAAPIPKLSPNFERELARRVDRTSQPIDRYRQVTLAGYGLASIVTSAVVMHNQGLTWAATAVLILVPLASTAIVWSARNVLHRPN